jgi:hypothetical protein
LVVDRRVLVVERWILIVERWVLVVERRVLVVQRRILIVEVLILKRRGVPSPVTHAVKKPGAVEPNSGTVKTGSWTKESRSGTVWEPIVIEEAARVRRDRWRRGDNHNLRLFLGVALTAL